MAVAPHELFAKGSVRSFVMEDGSVSGASESDPPVGRLRDTEQILEYYQSQDPSRSYVESKSSYPLDGQSDRETPSARAWSAQRLQSAGKGANGVDVGGGSIESIASSMLGHDVQRRTSQRSMGGGDKRRLAVMEIHSKYGSQSSLRPKNSYTSDSERSLLGRRGVDSSRIGGLVLVAPPDVHPTTYTDLSPVPTSAPPTGIPPEVGPTKAGPNGHQRSMSDAQSYKKERAGGSKTSPRDIGIVGTSEIVQANLSQRSWKEPPLAELSERQRPSSSDGAHKNQTDRSLMAPIFQIPKSRTPSPIPPTDGLLPPQMHTGEIPHSSHSWNVRPGSQQTSNTEQDIVEPGLPPCQRSPNAVTSALSVVEEPHEIRRDTQRATGRLPFKPNQAGLTYLHYQPGIHSTAGPLPSPPRHIFTNVTTSPPPRPPRLLSPSPNTVCDDLDHATKHFNKTPQSDVPKAIPIATLPTSLPASHAHLAPIVAISVSSSENYDRSSETSSKALGEDDFTRRPSGPRDVHETQTLSSRSSSHVREGAFPTSSVFLQPSQSPPQATLDETVSEEKISSSSDVPPSTAVEPLRILKRHRSRPDLKRKDSWVSFGAESLGDSLDETSLPSSYSSSSHENPAHVSATDPTSDGRARRKRLSLPAPPPDPQGRHQSLPRTPSLSFAHSSSRASLPLSQPILPKKAPSPWPEAMNFQQILTKKSAAERALAYAEKIRELATEVTGLGDWLAFSVRKERRGVPLSSVATSTLPRGSIKHPRQVSRSSMASEVTFPLRADSYAATDLSLRPTMDLASNLPPTLLPYPSLAHGVGLRNHPSHILMHSDSSSRGITSASNSSRSLGGAFFASIGRKGSTKKDRTPAASANKLISPRKTAPVAQPRPVKIAAPPTIPGGPRAPARRVNSFMPAPTSAEEPRSESQDASASLHPPLASVGPFDHQVEKLSDILPHADKDVLAIYLRRANNQDPMLAIGAYLEDEKRGTLFKQ